MTDNSYPYSPHREKRSILPSNRRKPTPTHHLLLFCTLSTILILLQFFLLQNSYMRWFHREMHLIHRLNSSFNIDFEQMSFLLNIVSLKNDFSVVLFLFICYSHLICCVFSLETNLRCCFNIHPNILISYHILFTHLNILFYIFLNTKTQIEILY